MTLLTSADKGVHRETVELLTMLGGNGYMVVCWKLHHGAWFTTGGGIERVESCRIRDLCLANGTMLIIASTY